MKKLLSVFMAVTLIAFTAPLSFAAVSPDDFTDITNHWAKGDIAALVERGMFEGISETLFNPEGTMSRAMVATVLYRYDGEKPPGANSFTDVAANAWYAASAAWAANNKILAGTTATTFSPTTPITREELASALYNYAKYRAAAPDQTKTSQTIRLSTTTSVNDTELLPFLQPEFEKDTGYKLEITSAGSGAAIEKGRTGDADALLVHAKSSEEAFINEGYGELRVPFMYNFFVIIGPADDPAGVKGSKSASEAFKKISENSAAKFVSRGDNSGTHTAEQNIWKAAGIEPTGDWYISAGQGMGASINMASQMEAYILTDKATYLAHAERRQFEILLEESDELINIYSLIAISTNRWDDANAAATAAFINWMTSEKAARLIDSYGVAKYEEKLFFTQLSPYTDRNSVSGNYLEAVNWSVGVGIIKGMTDTTVAPKGNATRAEVVTMLSRFLKLIETE